MRGNIRPAVPIAIFLVLATFGFLSCGRSAENPGPPLPLLAPGQQGECGIHSHTVERSNLLGFTLWQFTTVTRWCWNGKEIITEPHFYTDVDTLWPFWSYEGDADIVEVGGQGEEYHYDSAFGEFRLCIIGCTEHGRATISKSQYGNGNSTIEEAETTASFGADLVIALLVALFVAVLLTTGWRVLKRRSEGPAWHAVGMAEVVLGLLASIYVILLFVSLPAP